MQLVQVASALLAVAEQFYQSLASLREYSGRSPVPEECRNLWVNKAAESYLTQGRAV